MNLYSQAQNLIGVVYVHPTSGRLVVFVDIHCAHLPDPLMVWSGVGAVEYGFARVSTVLKGDGRWVKYEGTTSVLPYSHRS